MTNKLILCLFLLAVANAQYSNLNLLSSNTTCPVVTQVSFHPTNTSLAAVACYASQDAVILYSLASNNFVQISQYSPGSSGALWGIKFYINQSTYAVSSQQGVGLKLLQINSQSVSLVYSLGISGNLYNIDIYNGSNYVAVPEQNYLIIYQLTSSLITQQAAAYVSQNYCYGVAFANQSTILLSCENYGFIQYSFTGGSLTQSQTYTSYGSIPGIGYLYGLAFASGSSTQGIYADYVSGFYNFNFSSQNYLSGYNQVNPGGNVYSISFSPDNTRILIGGYDVLNLYSTVQNQTCQTGYYFASDLCWPCPVQCTACTNGITCSSCVGTTALALARVSAQTCECPATAYDNIVNSVSAVSCLTSCPDGYLQISNQCILSACLSIDLGINFSKFQFSLTAATDSLGDLQYSLWVNYTGTISPALSTCYQTYIYFVSSNGQLVLAPSIFNGSNLFSAFLQKDLVATYGCLQTNTSTTFVYNCTLSYQAYILGLQQINLNFTIGIAINRATSNVLSLGVNPLTSVQNCVSCNTVYSVATTAQPEYANGTARTSSNYNIGDAMIFVIQISDPSLRTLYYVDFVSATLTSGSISFTVTPASTIQSVLGQLTVNITASLAIPSATLTIIGQLSLTPSRRVLGTGIAGATAGNNIYDSNLQMTPTFLRGRLLQETIQLGLDNELERRALQSSSDGQLLRASYQLSIVDPSTNTQQSSTTTTNSQNSSGSSTTTIAIIVSVTAGGIALATMIACLAYHRLCKKGREINKDMEQAKQVGAEQKNQRADLYKDDEEEVAVYKDEKNKKDSVPKENLQLAQDVNSGVQLQ